MDLLCRIKLLANVSMHRSNFDLCSFQKTIINKYGIAYRHNKKYKKIGY